MSSQLFESLTSALKAGHTWFDSQPVHQECAEIQTINGQAECTNCHSLPLSQAAAIAASDNHGLLSAGTAFPSLGADNGLGGIPVSTVRVDGGIMQISFLQPVTAGNKFALSMAGLRLTIHFETFFTSFNQLLITKQ